MKQESLKRWVALILMFATLFSVVGCQNDEQGMDDETENVSEEQEQNEQNEQEKIISLEKSDGINDFAINLIKMSNQSGKNTLISPMSVAYALAMAINGAKGETLSQMEEVLGMSKEELNSKLADDMQSLSEDANAQLKTANSIWYKDDNNLIVNKDFLTTNQENFKAELTKAAFDNSTIKEINNWANENTDGMIKEIIKEIPKESVMFLMNAISFDAKWQDVYDETQVREGEFVREDGSKEIVEFMYSGEEFYLEDEYATGFLKKYIGNKYAFVALLPNKGISVSEYISKLSGEHLEEMFSNQQSVLVQASIPKFETEYKVEMTEILRKMGVTDAFDSDLADFTGMGTYKDKNIYLNRVFHKTYISVAEEGTRAAAITSLDYGYSAKPTEMKEVHLDRPFVYMLIDCEKNIPLFIGTMMNVNE